MKELIIVPKVSKSKMGAFLAEIKQDGVKTVYADPKDIAGSKMDALWTTKEAKYVIIKNNATKYKNKKIGKEFQVRSNEDIEDILQQAKKGLDFVIIEVKDWKIIPLLTLNSNDFDTVLEELRSSCDVSILEDIKDVEDEQAEIIIKQKGKQSLDIILYIIMKIPEILDDIF